jgi:Ala-tRNA(Pro) deacylase
MGVYVAEQLTEDDEIAFNAGTHSELVKMSYRDFANLVTPQVVSLT